ncbi:hypothetical protein BT93_G0429 [Corymbia citriodora subsp. variegata]|nr:hypothetical protein BT93_G0429 [Corymbia citriodora subsp. variegata]
MDDHLKGNLGDVKAKNSSEETLRRRRKAYRLVKNRRRRIRFAANLFRRSEAGAIRRMFKDSPDCPLYEEDSSDGDDEKVSKIKTSRVSDDDCSPPAYDEDDESEDEDDVGNNHSDNISEPVHNVSPNGITSWRKGKLLGSGSFGTVYKGINDEDGSFFAVKEVSLLDPGSQGKERLSCLQQEIAVLSDLHHENIVRYLGSDKDENKLYVFLELMTEGSLATLYYNHELRDSQVSKYTRQILNGLKYLHDQKVVHRYKKDA